MIPITKPYLGEEEVAAAREAILSGWVSQGPKVKEFEQNFASFVGSSHAIAVSNCTTALHLALLAVGVRPGDAVITVSHSFISTANSIQFCQAEPIFVDIDPNTFNMSVQALSDCLDSVDKKVSAILVVHQMGMPADLEKILSISKKHNIPVVEDAACAIGSEISTNGGKEWEKIGKPMGDVACFSFHPRKVITTGEGGMITTNSPEYDKNIRLLRHQGMSVSDVDRHESKKIIFEEYPVLGYNYRLTDIQAAIGIEQLKKAPDIVAKRREIADFYGKKLSSLSWIQVPLEPEFAKTNWQSYAVRVRNDAPCSRDQLMQHLLDKGIATRRGIMNSHQEKVYSGQKYSLPESESARDNVMLLPIFYQMTMEECELCSKHVAEVK